MVKVCHMTSAHKSDDIRIFQKECVSLAAAGYEVSLVARGDSREERGVHVIGVGMPKPGRLNRVFSFTKMIYEKAVSLDADLYHFHDPELIPQGIRLAKQGKKVIFDSHEDYVALAYDRYYIPRILKPIFSFLMDRYLRYAVRFFSSVISVTPRLTRYYSKYNKNVVEVSNYPIYVPVQHGERERAVVFAGGITDLWNHQRIISAIGNISDCRYLLCGPCKNDYMKELEKNPAWDRVDYLGKVPYNTVREVLSRASIGVALLLPSKNTGGDEGTMGNTKIFEEMMAGIPVVCTRFTLWEEFIQRYQCGISVNPTSVEEIQNAIQWLLDHPNKAKEMGLNGIKAVREEYNWEKEALKLIAMYRTLS